MIALVLLLTLVATPAMAQQQNMLSTDQMYREVIAALAQDNAKLGREIEQLKLQMQLKQLPKPNESPPPK